MLLDVGVYALRIGLKEGPIARGKLPRLNFILVGVGVIARLHWILYGFGAFLVWTGVKLALPAQDDAEVDPAKNASIKFTLTANEPLDGTTVTASDFSVMRKSFVFALGR